MTDATEFTVRAAEPRDLAAVARVWTEGWHDAHGAHASAEMLALRSEASFLTRAEARLPSTLVAEAGGVLAGFATVVGDEVEQVYVDRPWRGARAAAPLLAAAERMVAAAGFPRAWLAVIPQNRRARRFYEKQGWTDEGDFDYAAEGGDAEITVRCRRYTKQVSPSGTRR